MAIIGKCFEILFGKEPPTGRPPDPGGPGGGCGNDCPCNDGCICDNSCPDPTFWRCREQYGYCVPNLAGLSDEALCNDGCEQTVDPDPECRCEITSFTSELEGDEGTPTSPGSQRLTITMIQDCKEAGGQWGDIAGIISSEFTDDPNDNWGDWSIGGPQPAPNQACDPMNGSCEQTETCPYITVVGTREENLGHYICNYYVCIEDPEEPENNECLIQTTIEPDKATCDFIVANNPQYYSDLPTCELFCAADDECTGYYCGPAVGSAEGCFATKACKAVTIDPGDDTCDYARSQHNPPLGTDDTCGGPTECCPEYECWWTCDAGPGGSTQSDCVGCNKTDNTGCAVPPDNVYAEADECVTAEENCDFCVDRYLCDTVSNVNTNTHCGVHSVKDEGASTIGHAEKNDCEPTCFNGVNCNQSENPWTCEGATGYGATYAEPNAMSRCTEECSDSTWICIIPTDGEPYCDQTGPPLGDAGAGTETKQECQQVPGSECIPELTWICEVDSSNTSEGSCEQNGPPAGDPAAGTETKRQCEDNNANVCYKLWVCYEGTPNSCIKDGLWNDPNGHTTKQDCEDFGDGGQACDQSTGGPGGGTSTGPPGGQEGGGDPPPPAGNNIPPPNTDSDIKITREVKNKYREYLEGIQFPYRDSTTSDPTVSNRGFNVQNKFVPISNGHNVRLDIFSNVIHASLNYILTLSNNDNYLTNEVAFDDTTITNIYLSLNKKTKKIIDNAYDSLGQPLKDQILTRLRYLILTRRVDDFDLEDIQYLGNKKKDAIRLTLTSEETALTDISTKGKPLSYKAYKGLDRDRMKMWKTLAPDLDKAIPIVLADSTVAYIDINMDDSYTFTLSGGGTETRYINDGDYITFVTPTGELSYLELYSDIDKAKMLDIADTVRIHNLYGDSHFFKFSVSSDETELVEETYSLTTPRPEKYILKLDPSTVEDLPREKTVIRKSKASYSVITDEAEINSWISTKPWPYLTKYIDHQDPFLNHLESSNSLSVEFKDVSFDQFYGYEEQFPILPRRIPWYIVVIPTDKTKYSLGASMSVLTGFSSRELKFSYSPFLNETIQRWDPSLFVYSEGSRGDGILPFDEEDFPMSLTYSPTKFSMYVFPYKKGSEALPRKSSYVKTFLTALSAAKALGVDYVDVAGTTMPWGSIYKNISLSDKKALYMLEGGNWGTLKGKIETNTFASDLTVRERYTKLSESPFLDITSADKFVTPDKKTRPTKVDIDPPAPTPEEL